MPTIYVSHASWLLSAAPPHKHILPVTSTPPPQAEEAKRAREAAKKAVKAQRQRLRAVVEGGQGAGWLM